MTSTQWLEEWGYPARVPVPIIGIAPIAEQVIAAAEGAQRAALEEVTARKTPRNWVRSSKKPRSDRNRLIDGSIGHRCVLAVIARPGMRLKEIISAIGGTGDDTKSAGRAMSQLVLMGIVDRKAQKNGKNCGTYFPGEAKWTVKAPRERFYATDGPNVAIQGPRSGPAGMDGLTT